MTTDQAEATPTEDVAAPAQLPVDPEGMKKATRKGLIAAALLAVLTVIEFFVAIGFEEPLLPLLPFVILKGWIILDSFMHVRAVFGDEDH